MNPTRALLLSAAMLAARSPLTAQAAPSPAPSPDSQYRLGPDSMPQEGVPKGEIRGPYTLPCTRERSTRTGSMFLRNMTLLFRPASWSSTMDRHSRIPTATCARRT